MTTPAPVAHGRTRSLIILAAFFVLAGGMHFVVPSAYQRIVPPWVPDARLAVALSGIAEILGGCGLLIAATRRAAAWCLIVLMVAVFPANIHMLRLAQIGGASELWQGTLWLRLAFQPMIIWWISRAALRRY